MPFSFSPRAPLPIRPAAVAPPRELPSHPFRGWTDSLYVTGLVRGHDRLSDLFNRREPLVVEDAGVLPHGANDSALVFAENPLFDPFDFDVVLGNALDCRTAAERNARRIYKVQYEVIIRAGDFEVRGYVHLFPGNAPELAMHHTNVLFMPVTAPVVRRARRLVSDPNSDVALVNRFAVTSISQVDRLS